MYLQDLCANEPCRDIMIMESCCFCSHYCTCFRMVFMTVECEKKLTNRRPQSGTHYNLKFRSICITIMMTIKH